MIDRFDLWLGKTLFVPIDIRICQHFKITQYALYRYLWLGAMLLQLTEGPMILGWIVYSLTAAVLVLMVCAAALFPDRAMRDHPFFRWLWVCFTAGDIFLSIVELATHHPLSTLESLPANIMILFAEYALTIKTIPPLETKEKKTSAKLAREGA